MNSDITAHSLRKVFLKTTALHNVDLDVPESSIYALVGPNGSGKTTLIKTLLNIHRPTSGNSEVLGIDSKRLAGRAFERIGYVSENQECPQWMTVEQFLRFLQPFYPTWDSKLASEMLKQFRLPSDRKLGQLSRGMLMKTQLVSSLAYRPRLVVLDEPFTGLDAMVRDELIEGLLARAEGTTIFISSHDLNELDSFASHMGYLDEGVLEFSEDIDSLHGRFREIIVTLNSAATLPVEMPKHWLLPEAAGTVVHFIESRYDEQKTDSEIRRLFPQIKDLTVTPMPLRSIFIALAKHNRTKGAWHA
jgi:ABC-2 type transport system ATP-binding protein